LIDPYCGNRIIVTTAVDQSIAWTDAHSASSLIAVKSRGGGSASARAI
jgi:hypothetical protein